MKNLFFLIAVAVTLIFVVSCNTPAEIQQPTKPKLPTGDYFGLTVGTTAEMFAKGIVSREFQELNAVFSPVFGK